MKISINAINTATDISNCTTIQERQQATIRDYHPQQLRQNIITG